MKRNDLEKLGLTAETIEKAGLEKDVIDKIMDLHGKDIEVTKSGLDKSEEIKALQSQLAEANSQIEEMKKLNPEELQKAAADWEQKAKDFQAQAEQAQKDADARVQKYQFNAALTDALREAKAKDPKEILPHLDMETIVFKDGKFTGLDDQLKPLQESKDYLFNSNEPQPKIVTKTNNHKVVGDPFTEAVFKGANLKQPE